MEKINETIQLSETQITNLFKFTEKKFVHWYDLQIEIVDHLASSIETEMSSTTGLTFELALEKVYKSFGIFGFAKIVQEKQNQLARSAKKIWWSELINIFSWPRILFVFMIISLIYSLSLLVDSSLRSALFIFIYITISALFFIYVVKDNRLQKPLLLMQSGSTYFSFPFTFEFIVLSTYTNMSSLSFTVLLTIGILIKLTSFKLYRKVKTEAKIRYPLAFAR